MKFWRSALVFILVVGLAGFIGCKRGGKYADAKDVMDQMLQVMESFAGDMEKAGDSQAVVRAVNAYAAGMGALKPKFQALEKKYPELKDQTDPPEELKPQATKMEEMSDRLMNAMMKLIQYADDPEVQKAQEALGKLMMDED